MDCCPHVSDSNAVYQSAAVHDLSDSRTRAWASSASCCLLKRLRDDLPITRRVDPGVRHMSAAHEPLSSHVQPSSRRLVGVRFDILPADHLVVRAVYIRPPQLGRSDPLLIERRRRPVEGARAAQRHVEERVDGQQEVQHRRQRPGQPRREGAVGPAETKRGGAGVEDGDVRGQSGGAQEGEEAVQGCGAAVGEDVQAEAVVVFAGRRGQAGDQGQRRGEGGLGSRA